MAPDTCRACATHGETIRHPVCAGKRLFKMTPARSGVHAMDERGAPPSVADIRQRKVEQFALFGGRPAFSQPLHVGRPNIGNKERLMARFAEVLDSGWLSNAGPNVKRFEQTVAASVGVKHCIAMCNATVALEISARALGMRGEVIVPAFTFVATAHALQWQGIRPVFCDVDRFTHTIDPASVERMITSRTTGIVGVHLWGRGCDVEALTAIANTHSLRLLFDAAHGFGCSHGGRMIGGFGDAEVFSFHATKFVNSFEGGAVVTNDDDLAQRIRLMKNFGFRGADDVGYIGTNGKMSEISAVMGLTSIEDMNLFIAHNSENRARYSQLLQGLPGVRLQRLDSRERSNHQYIITEIDEEFAGLSRDVLLQLLHAENVLARRYFYPGVHRMEPYRSQYPDPTEALPNTMQLCTRVLSLPNGMAVAADDIEKICALIHAAVANGPAIMTALSAQQETAVAKPA